MWLQQQGNKLDQSILDRLIERIEKLEEKIKLLERKRINQKDTKNVI